MLSLIFWQLVYGLFILGLGLFLGGWLAGISRTSLERSRIDPAVRQLIVSLVRPVVVIIALIAALDVVGVELTALVAVLGAATLAIGLSMKSSLANVAAGAVLLTVRPYRGGDWVTLAGRSGTVTELGLLTTTLKTPQGIEVVIANDLILRQPIDNATRNGLRRHDLVVRVSPTANLAKAQEALLGAFGSDERVLEEPAPFVRVQGIDARGVDLLAAGWFRTEDFGQGKSDITAAARDALKKAKVELTTTNPVIESA